MIEPSDPAINMARKAATRENFIFEYLQLNII
jgi:hypothetical protein